MSTRITRSVAVALVAAAAAVVFISFGSPSRSIGATAAASSAVPGVTANSITFGSHQPLTGPGRAGL